MAPTVDTSTIIPKTVELKSATTSEIVSPHVTAPGGATHQSYLMSDKGGVLQKESSPTKERRTATMGTDNDSGLPEHLRQQRDKNTDTHCYGLDRYSWNQGQNAKFDFQIFEDIEPGIVARGGSGCICYQERIGALCATDYKWVQQEQVMQNKLVICRKR